MRAPRVQQFIPTSEVAKAHGCDARTVRMRARRAGVELVNLNPHGDRPSYAIRPDDVPRLLEAPAETRPTTPATPVTKQWTVESVFNVPGWK
jgi:hypothetical protein